MGSGATVPVCAPEFQTVASVVPVELGGGVSRLLAAPLARTHLLALAARADERVAAGVDPRGSDQPFPVFGSLAQALAAGERGAKVEDSDREGAL